MLLESASSERAMWDEYARTRNVELRNRLVMRYQWLVQAVVRSLVQRGLPMCVDPEDLVSVGTLGLIAGIEGYDVARSVKFNNYATTRIRGAILDELRALDWVPHSVRYRVRSYAAAIRQLSEELGRSPSTAEIAQFLGTTEAAVKGIVLDTLHLELSQFVNESSLEEESVRSRGHRGVTSMLQLFVHPGIRRPDEILTENLFPWLLLKLGRQARMIILLYYAESLTLKEIGSTLGITESRVSRIVLETIAFLKAYLKRNPDLV